MIVFFFLAYFNFNSIITISVLKTELSYGLYIIKCDYSEFRIICWTEELRIVGVVLSKAPKKLGK